MSVETDLVEEFLAAFNRRDVDAIMAMFAADAVYHNLPMAPVEGHEAIRGLVEFFVNPADSLDWEVTHIAQTGSTVLTERLDRFVIAGKAAALPVMGAFDIRDGKIAAWRDYFDMATWQRQIET